MAFRLKQPTHWWEEIFYPACPPARYVWEANRETSHLVVVSDTHPGRGNNTGHVILAKYINELPDTALLAYNGDALCGDSVALELFKHLNWNAEALLPFQATADFMRRGGQVVFIPGNHNVHISKWFVQEALKRGVLELPLGEYEKLREELHPDLSQSDFAELSKITVVSSLLVRCGQRVHYLEHGHGMDFFVPTFIGGAEKALKKLGLLKEPDPSDYDQPTNIARGRFLMERLRIRERYAALAAELGANEVWLGHWYCAKQSAEGPVVFDEWESGNHNVIVRVASCMTNGQAIITEAHDDGLVKSIDLFVWFKARKPVWAL